jgi:hypothetical protein
MVGPSMRKAIDGTLVYRGNQFQSDGILTDTTDGAGSDRSAERLVSFIEFEEYQPFFGTTGGCSGS